MGGLHGQTALVTGASRGIGRAIARRLAADGARVAVHYGSNTGAAEQTVAAIERDGGAAFAVRAELGVDGDVDTLFAALEPHLDGALHIVVNNASVIGPTGIAGTDEAGFDRVFAVNARAPLFIVRRALGLMPGGGRIVNISSMVTRTAPSEVAYVMTKGALDVMGRTLASELGPRGITVNTVAPGATETDMMAATFTPAVRDAAARGAALGRLGTPEDIAGVVAFLVSADAGWVTGQCIDAGGGLFLRPGVR